MRKKMGNRIPYLASLNKIRKQKKDMWSDVSEAVVMAAVVKVEGTSNSVDKIPMLAFGDNGHGTGHVSSVNKLLICVFMPWRVCGITSIFAFLFSNVDDLPSLRKVEGWQRARIVRLSNLCPQAHTGHGLMQTMFITFLLKRRIDT
nr:hypothetical protein [Tanacetum cinerariifolium]